MKVFVVITCLSSAIFLSAYLMKWKNDAKIAQDRYLATVDELRQNGKTDLVVGTPEVLHAVIADTIVSSQVRSVTIAYLGKDANYDDLKKLPNLESLTIMYSQPVSIEPTIKSLRGLKELKTYWAGSEVTWLRRVCSKQLQLLEIHVFEETVELREEVNALRIDFPDCSIAILSDR